MRSRRPASTSATSRWSAGTLVLAVVAFWAGMRLPSALARSLGRACGWLVVNPSRAAVLLRPQRPRRVDGRGIEIVDGGTPPRPIDAIVVAGGDGTLVAGQSRAQSNSTCRSASCRWARLTNSRARSRFPPTLPAPARRRGGTRATIDTARVNGAYFVNEASIGVSSRIARRQRPGDKQRYGIFAIAMSLRAYLAAWRRFHVELAFDGTTERLRAVQITIANSHRFGGVVTVRVRRSTTDGSISMRAERERCRAVLRSGCDRRAAAPPAAGLRTYSAKAFERRHEAAASHQGRRRARGQDARSLRDRPSALRVFAP